MTERAVDVVVQVAGVDVSAGRLWGHRRRGRESATFAYLADYLGDEKAYELDPALQLVSGSLQTPEGQPIFGAFSDSAPDRWGRRLIARAEEKRAKAQDQAPRSHGEFEYLLGVRDDLRQGAIRFRDAESGTYEAEEKEGVPFLLDLPELLSAAESVERDEATELELAALLRGGSSLGGARPKAHVIDADGRLSIAKFPSPNDSWDVIRWEAVAIELADRSAIHVPKADLDLVDGKAVLRVVRFDRSNDVRIGYVSAMTMLEASDGDQASYTDIGAVIELYSPQATEDLHELWRRIAFSVLISNTDDHLRNHGFLRTSSAGWTLSPAFDLNPDPRGEPKLLSTAIAGSDFRAELAPLLDAASSFRLNRDQALEVLAEVHAAVGGWRDAAEAVGLGESEIDRMTPAFEHAQAEAVAQLMT